MSATWIAGNHWLTTIYNASNQSGRIDIIGTIGGDWWDDSGTTEKEFRDELAKIPQGTKLDVHINSEGGSIKDGLGMYNALKERRADVTCYVDGYAVSIASVIALAGARTISPKSSIWMIHEPWSVTQGNSEDHLRSAEMLDKHGDTLAAIYAEETGKSKSELRDAMRKETWLTGDEATAYGLADECPEGQPAFAALDVTKFRNIPKPILNQILAARANGDTNAAQSSAIADVTPTQPVTAQAASLSAVHGNGGVAGTVASNSTPNQPMPDNTPAATVTPPANAELEAIKAQLAAEKRSRITQRVQSYLGRITNDDVPIYVDAALRDEAGTFAVLDKKEQIPVAGSPIAHRITTVEHPLENINKEPNARKRFLAVQADWNALLEDAQARDARGDRFKGNRLHEPTDANRTLPRGENTYTSTLVTQFLLDGSITQLQNRWAYLKAYLTDFSADRYKPLAIAQLKYATAGSTTLTITDGASFESGDSTVTNVQIALSYYAQPFHVTATQLNSGLRMENLIDINTAYLANKITEVATAPITVANYETTGGQTSLVSAASSFGFSDLATLWGQLKKAPKRNVLLDGEYLARLLNNPSFFQETGNGPGNWGGKFGWDGIYLNTDWTGAAANVHGFACHPQAIAAVAGLPLTPPNVPGATLMESTITVPDVNISVAAYSWFSLATRTMWMSYDLIFGAAAADKTAGVLIKSA